MRCTHLLSTTFVTLVTLLLAGCPRPGGESLDRAPDEGNERGAVRSDSEDPGTGEPSEQASQEESARDVLAGGREVDLRVNGELLRVVRPSLANPFIVAGGEFESEMPTVLRSPPSDEGPDVSHQVHRVIDVIRGVPQQVPLNVSDPNGMGDIIGYYVQFQGYDGYFFVRTEIDSELFGAEEREEGRAAVQFFMDEVFPPGAERDEAWAQRYNEPFQVQMLVWAVDRARHVSTPLPQVLNVLPVGRGDLEVTLSMSLPSDLDLYVVEPNGNVIYYGNMRSLTNGQLDLDANAACNSNTNVRYEHIFWPEGQVPEGTYQIRVDNWANCVGGQPVDFEVIVQNCGDISVFEGRAEGQGGRSSCTNPNQSSCQHLASIEVETCDRPRDATTAQAPR